MGLDIPGLYYLTFKAGSWALGQYADVNILILLLSLQISRQKLQA